MSCTACANVSICLLADALATFHSVENTAASAPGIGLSVIPVPDLAVAQSATSRRVLLGAFSKVAVFFLSNYS